MQIWELNKCNFKIFAVGVTQVECSKYLVEILGSL